MPQTPASPVEQDRTPFEFTLAEFIGRTDRLPTKGTPSPEYDDAMVAERRAELTAADVDPDEVRSVRSFGRLKAGTLRRIAGQDDAAAMFTVLADVDEHDLMDALDELEVEELGRLWVSWQLRAGVNFPES